MQLVIMSPTNTESCLLISYTYAFRIWSVRITKVAMTESCTMMRIEGGILLRSRLTTSEEQVVTAITARHMTKAVSIFVVTASAEQMPST